MLQIVLWLLVGIIASGIALWLFDRSLARYFNADPSNTWNAKDKVIVVTGASAGIGADMCRQWAAQGARLVLVARREDRLTALAEECKRLGAPSATPVAADVSDEKQCRQFVERAIEVEGKIDCLVLNAGVSMSSYVEHITDPSLFRTLMDVNYYGCVMPAFFALPHLKSRPFGTARIVVISSGTAKVSSPTRSGYAASKCALHGFFDALRMELARRYGIGVLIACPPAVATEIHTTRLSGTKHEFAASMSSSTCASIILNAVANNKREELFRVSTSAATLLRPWFPWVTDYVTILFMKRFKLFTEDPLEPLPQNSNKKD